MKLEMEVELYKRSYYDFFIDAWQILEPDTKLVLNWHYKYIADILQEEVFRITRKEHKDKDYIFNVPPRSGKSSLVTIFLPAWAWIVNPHLRFITLSFGDDLAQKHALFSKKIIQSDWYQKRFGDIYKLSGDQNTKNFYLTDKMGFRKAAGTGGQVTGEGGNILIVDDAINPKKARSAVERETVLDLWRTSFHNRINDKDVDLRIIVGQRLHEEDLPGYLLANNAETYKHICIPADTDGEIFPPELEEKYVDGLFSPERFSRKILDEEKAGLGAIDYAGQYLQMPTPKTGAIVPVDYIQTWKPEVLPQYSEADARAIFEEHEKHIIECERNKKTPLPLDVWYRYNVVWHFFFDTANGLENSDKSAGGAYCTVDNNNLYLRDVLNVNLQTPELCEAIYHFVLRNGYSRRSSVIIEGQSNGHAVEQTLRKRYSINARLDKKDGLTAKMSKEERMLCHKEFFLSKRFHVLEGATWVKPLIIELKMFSKGKFDDQVDMSEGMIRNGSRTVMRGVVGF